MKYQLIGVGGRVIGELAVVPGIDPTSLRRVFAPRTRLVPLEGPKAAAKKPAEKPAEKPQVKREE